MLVGCQDSILEIRAKKESYTVKNTTKNIRRNKKDIGFITINMPRYTTIIIENHGNPGNQCHEEASVGSYLRGKGFSLPYVIRVFESEKNLSDVEILK
jgi:hypothetical protein